ncbi:MAG: hypothetical protein ACRC5A_10940 [Enterobacteriaceae bacterium]
MARNFKKIWSSGGSNLPSSGAEIAQNFNDNADAIKAEFDLKDMQIMNLSIINNKNDYTAATARAAVPTNFRKPGSIISYTTSTGVITEQYIGYDTTQWGNDGNWMPFADGRKLVQLEQTINKETLEDGSENVVLIVNDDADRTAGIGVNSRSGKASVFKGAGQGREKKDLATEEYVDAKEVDINKEIGYVREQLLETVPTSYNSDGSSDRYIYNEDDGGSSSVLGVESKTGKVFYGCGWNPTSKPKKYLAAEEYVGAEVKKVADKNAQLEQDVIKLYYKGYGGHIIPKEFVDSWNYRFKKWGRYNEASGYFQFMQEDKITYPEAIEVIASGCYAHLDDYSHYRNSSANQYIPSPKVVTISHWGTSYIPFTGDNLCYYRSYMTVFSYAYYSVDSNNSDSGIKLKKNGVNLFAYCDMLKYINSTLDVSDIVSVLNISFDSCNELIEVKLKGLNMNIRFKDSKNISKNSLVYMLSNRINAVSSPIVITLHNEAYNRLSNDADVTALLPATSTKGSVVLSSI